MGVRRPAFALVLVLLLVGAVFAMTVHSAAVLRSSMSETSAVAASQADLRTAHSAASVVLKAIGVTTVGSGGAGSDGSTGSAADPEDGLDLPPIVRQLLEAAGADLDLDSDGDDDGGTIDGGGSGDGAEAEQAQPGKTNLNLPAGAVVMLLDNRRVTVELRDAAGGLNINRVNEEALRRYLQLKGLGGSQLRAVVDQILDWRDPDGVPRERGMELEGYRLRGMSPRNGGFVVLEELRMLPAVTDEVYELIRRDLCLSGDGVVHLGSASGEVLRSVGGLSDGQAREILSLRGRGLLDDEAIERILGSDRGDGWFRVASSPLVGLRVVVESDNGARRVFEGHAVFSGRKVMSFGLREVADAWPAMMGAGTEG